MAGPGDQAKPISLFYSYSHEDEDLRRKLEAHLAALRRGGLIAEWHDRKLEPGDAWKDEIDRHLTSADIVLLLVSSDFIDSDYCWSEEMTKALQRHARGEALVVPVILRHCRWTSTPLGALQAVPRDAKPIKAWPDEDEAFDDVVAAIERLVEKARAKASSKAEPTLPGELKRGSPDSLLDLTVFRDIDAPWCPEMVVIPAGSFLMGSPENEDGRSGSEKPQHRVRFATPFALGEYPVTFEEYDHFCSETRRKKRPDQGWGRGRRPVINVSWEDAKACCTWLSKQTRHLYRLPSEAEWEYACRAGTTTSFWTGTTITGEQANYDLNGEQTSTVDSFAANPWGLHDMHGNVREWCEDWWNDNYVGAPEDGSAWLTGTSSGRAVRGGSWDLGPSDLRSAYREGYMLGIRNQDLGFRVSRTLAN